MKPQVNLTAQELIKLNQHSTNAVAYLQQIFDASEDVLVSIIKGLKELRQGETATHYRYTHSKKSVKLFNIAGAMVGVNLPNTTSVEGLSEVKGYELDAKYQFFLKTLIAHLCDRNGWRVFTNGTAPKYVQKQLKEKYGITY